MTGLSASAALLVLPRTKARALDLSANTSARKCHLVTLSFDDGFRKSFERTAEIYERYGLAACLNIVANGMPEDEYIRGRPVGDFELWNELQARGHEVMPHGFRHENLTKMPLAEAQALVQRCLEVFAANLRGFKREQAVFNFPYNSSSPELEAWLRGQVRAFRTAGAAINAWPTPATAKVTCVSHGPDSAEAAIDEAIAQLLRRDSGWLVFNTHGLDGEGWGPIRSDYLERLLERLLNTPSVELLPTGRALAKYAPLAA